MIKKTWPLLIAVITILTISCEANKNPGQVKTVPEENNFIIISAEEARRMIESEDVIILDVRTAEEFAAERIEGALLIPDYEIKTKAPELLPDKEATILVYCRSGRRSKLASQDLIDMGYINVYEFGGIIDWPYDTISGSP